MRRPLLAALVLLLATRADGGPPPCIFRVHAEANTRDSAAFAQSVRSLTGRNVFMEKTASLTERDVKAYCPYRAADGSYGALLELDDHGRTVLDTLSIERQGAYLRIFLNGRPLTELQVDRRVSDGKIYLASGLTGADIKSMNRDWKLISGRKKK